MSAEDAAGPDGAGGQADAEEEKGADEEEHDSDVEVCVADFIGNREVQRWKRLCTYSM